MADPINIQLLIEDLERHESEILAGAITIANGIQSQFRFRPKLKKIKLPGKRKLDCDRCLDWLLKRLPRNGDRLLCVTTRKFLGNYRTTDDRRVSVFSITDAEWRYAPLSLESHMLFRLAGAMVSFAADSSEIAPHKKSTGCLMDFRARKSDLRFDMMAGYICGKCRGELLQLGAKVKQIDGIERILHYVSASAIGRKPHIEWNSAFVVMRFSEGDENQKAYLKGIRPGLQDVGITPRRADDQVEARQLLDKINDAIDKAHFIIARVDAENLNVYYELGLAMGLKKDVLLISEKPLNLPSDLSNWECLTYKAGDYTGLRKSIAKFFRDNYHFEKRAIKKTKGKK